MRVEASRGVSAIELVVALVLFALVVNGAWVVFASGRRAAEALRVRTEIFDAQRTVRVVLGAELGAGHPRRDWTVTSPGIVDLRAFRGWAAVCPTGTGKGGATWVVAFRGYRSPDPAKDSVLVLSGTGPWRVAGVVESVAEEDGCPAAPGASPASGISFERWTLDRVVEEPVLLRLFEHGSYHLDDGSLRYRRGLGGRQPLTPPVLDPAESGVVAWDSGGAARVKVRGFGGQGATWSRTISGNGARLP